MKLPSAVVAGLMARLRSGTSMLRTKGVTQTAQLVLSPTRYLAVVNVTCTLLGFTVSFVNMRVLGAELYGIVAIIGASSGTMLNFLDVRLTDLTAKLYYRQDIPMGVGRSAYRASVIQLCLVGNGVISLAAGTLGLLVGVLTIGLFTASPVRTEWIVAQSVILALNHWTSSFTYMQRFSGRFYLMGTWRAITRVIGLIVIVLIVVTHPNLDGYYAALFLAEAVSAAMGIGLSLFIWLRYEEFPMFRSDWLVSLPSYRDGARFLVFGNLLGYSKMLHRSADALLVGYFCGDRETGIYKFARSLTDTLLVLFDAMNQVYYPRFLELMSKGRFDEYRRLARRLVSRAGLLTVVILAGEALFLPTLLRVVLADRFAGAEPTIMVMTVTFFLVAGVHIWMWPLFVHSGRLGQYTACTYLSCASHYGVSIILFIMLGPVALAGGIGYLAYDLLLTLLAFLLLRKWFPAFVPGGRIEAKAT